MERQQTRLWKEAFHLALSCVRPWSRFDGDRDSDVKGPAWHTSRIATISYSFLPLFPMPPDMTLIENCQALPRRGGQPLSSPDPKWHSLVSSISLAKRALKWPCLLSVANSSGLLFFCFSRETGKFPWKKYWAAIILYVFLGEIASQVAKKGNFLWPLLHVYVQRNFVQARTKTYPALAQICRLLECISNCIYWTRRTLSCGWRRLISGSPCKLSNLALRKPQLKRGRCPWELEQSPWFHVTFVRETFCLPSLIEHALRLCRHKKPWPWLLRGESPC